MRLGEGAKKYLNHVLCHCGVNAWSDDVIWRKSRAKGASAWLQDFVRSTKALQHEELQELTTRVHDLEID